MGLGRFVQNSGASAARTRLSQVVHAHAECVSPFSVRRACAWHVYGGGRCTCLFSRRLRASRPSRLAGSRKCCACCTTADLPLRTCRYGRRSRVHCCATPRRSSARRLLRSRSGQLASSSCSTIRRMRRCTRRSTPATSRAGSRPSWIRRRPIRSPSSTPRTFPSRRAPTRRPCGATGPGHARARHDT